MKKTIIFLIIIAAVFVSCKQLSKDNPYDPASPNYINVHYISEAWYPANTTISAMAFANGFVYVAGVKLGLGDCVIKIVDAAGTSPVASTPLGAFSNISDICADDSGNVYITDDKQAVQVMDSGGNFTSFSFSNMTTPGNLQMEWAANSIFISNGADKKIYKYSETGVPAVPDSIVLSCTANGYFTPGKIFKTDSYIYVVNKDKKSEIVRLLQDLSDAGTFLFSQDISDGVETGVLAEVLSGQAVFRVDSSLAVALKWGDYGEGPGKIINGKRITYNSAGKLIYILDGGSIKIFGE